MDSLEKKRKDLEKLHDELQAFQQKMEGGEYQPTTQEAEAMDAKAGEVMKLQTELDQAVKRSENLQRALNWKPVEADLPNPSQPKPDTKRADDVVGYMSIGEFVVAQNEYKRFVDQGMPEGAHIELAKVPSLIRGKRETQPLVPLTKAQVQKIYEAKAVPTIGTGVIDPQRIPGLVKATEFDTLRLRDILNVIPTTSNMVEWVREVSFTRAAEITAHGAQKPEAAKEFELVQSPIRTIAVWMPVHDQQLSDWAQLQSIINENLLYDVEKRLEEQIMWGDGTGINFLGFFNDPAVWACGQMDAAGTTRVVVGEPLLDTIRRGITDVRVAGYSPNGVLVHPYDWETIVLSKATDNQYIWAMVQNAQVPRLWGVTVIETEACQAFEGDATEERNILVGDFTRGAALFDRMQSSVQVGWINDQFIRNMRTLRAELRAGFGIWRPRAFRDFTAQAAVES